MLRKIFGAIAGMFLTVAGGCATKSGTGFITIDPNEALAMIARDSSALLLDVRTHDEYRTDGHIRGAMVIPVQELASRIGELEKYKGRPIITYCRSGARSTKAGEMLVKAGHTVYMIDGGMIRWKREGLAVETASK